MWPSLSGRGQTSGQHDPHFHDCQDQDMNQQSRGGGLLSWVMSPRKPPQPQQQQQPQPQTHQQQYSRQTGPAHSHYDSATPAAGGGSLAAYSRTPSHGSANGSGLVQHTQHHQDASPYHRQQPQPTHTSLQYPEHTSPVRGVSPTRGQQHSSFHATSRGTGDDRLSQEFIDQHLSKVKSYYDARIHELERALIAAQREAELARQHAGPSAAAAGLQHYGGGPSVGLRGGLTDAAAMGHYQPNGQFSFVASVRAEIGGNPSVHMGSPGAHGMHGHSSSILDRPPSPRAASTSPGHQRHPQAPHASLFRYE